MLEIKEIQIPGYKKVIEAIDDEIHLHCFIAIHNTNLGPALGGARFYPYTTRQEALNDVLRLSEAMTYKSSLAKSGTGGGKSVIIGNPKVKTIPLLHRFAEVINSLKGDYIVAEDMGTSTNDMLILHEITPYVAALPTLTSSGDPSRFTAWGVYKSCQAVAKKLWGNPSLKDKRILIQGLGNVGLKLADFLFWEGADLILEELNVKKAKIDAVIYSAKVIENQNFWDIECDIFSPCAIGGIIKKEIVPSLKCKAIVGSANNQLDTDETGILLQKKNILYAPDFVVNAGGLLNATAEFNPLGYDSKLVLKQVNDIYTTLFEIFDKAEKENKSTLEIANEMALYNLKHHIGKRLIPIQFK